MIKIFDLRNSFRKDVGLLMTIAWIGYIIADVLDVSGVICILVTSIVSSYYGIPNLDENSRLMSRHFFMFVGEGLEALVFCYLGLTTYTYNIFNAPILFIIALFGVTIVARLVGTFILIYVFRVFTWNRNGLGCKNLLVVWLGGVVRGVISFALALGITGNNSEVLQVTTLAFVIVGTLIFGTVLPIVIKVVNLKISVAGVSILDSDFNEPKTSEKYKKIGWFRRKWKKFNENCMKKLLIRQNNIIPTE